MIYKHDIFVSYPHSTGKTVVEPLSDALSAAGFVLWLDEKSIRWGEDLGASIEKGLTESRYILVVLSDADIGRVWPTLELGKVFFENRGRILPLIVGDEKIISNAYGMLAQFKYSKWNGDPRVIVEQLKSLDDSYFKKVWSHNHPADYTGRVWIGVLPSLRRLNVQHKFTVEWGSWRFPVHVNFTSAEELYYVHKKKRAGESFEIIVNIDPPAHVDFGTGSPPEPRAIKMKRGWYRASE